LHVSDLLEILENKEERQYAGFPGIAFVACESGFELGSGVALYWLKVRSFT